MVVGTQGEGLVEGLQSTLPKTPLTPGPSKVKEVPKAGQAIRKLEGLVPRSSITSSTPIEPCWLIMAANTLSEQEYRTITISHKMDAVLGSYRSRAAIILRTALTIFTLRSCKSTEGLTWRSWPSQWIVQLRYSFGTWSAIAQEWYTYRKTKSWTCIAFF